jgi:hypothetical protein
MIDIESKTHTHLELVWHMVHDLAAWQVDLCFLLSSIILLVIAGGLKEGHEHDAQVQRAALLQPKRCGKHEKPPFLLHHSPHHQRHEKGEEEHEYDAEAQQAALLKSKGLKTVRSFVVFRSK